MRCDMNDVQAIKAVLDCFKMAQFIQMSGADIIALHGSLAQLTNLAKRIQEDLAPKPAPMLKSAEPKLMIKKKK